MRASTRALPGEHLEDSWRYLPDGAFHWGACHTLWEDGGQTSPRRRGEKERRRGTFVVRRAVAWRFLLASAYRLTISAERVTNMRSALSHSANGPEARSTSTRCAVWTACGWAAAVGFARARVDDKQQTMKRDFTAAWWANFMAADSSFPGREVARVETSFCRGRAQS